jgi:hypothetical protein
MNTLGKSTAAPKRAHITLAEAARIAFQDHGGRRAANPTEQEHKISAQTPFSPASPSHTGALEGVGAEKGHSGKGECLVAPTWLEIGGKPGQEKRNNLPAISPTKARFEHLRLLAAPSSYARAEKS